MSTLVASKQQTRLSDDNPLGVERPLTAQQRYVMRLIVHWPSWGLIEESAAKEYGLTADEFKAVLPEYQRFLYLSYLGYPNLAMFSYYVDKVWHSHILNLQLYLTFCQDILGYTVYHVPNLPSQKKDDESRNGVRLFKRAYQQVYGSKLPSIWYAVKSERPLTDKELEGVVCEFVACMAVPTLHRSMPATLSCAQYCEECSYCEKALPVAGCREEGHYDVHCEGTDLYPTLVQVAPRMQELCNHVCSNFATLTTLPAPSPIAETCTHDCDTNPAGAATCRGCNLTQTSHPVASCERDCYGDCDQHTPSTKAGTTCIPCTGPCGDPVNANRRFRCQSFCEKSPSCSDKRVVAGHGVIPMLSCQGHCDEPVPPGCDGNPNCVDAPPKKVRFPSLSCKEEGHCDSHCTYECDIPTDGYCYSGSIHCIKTSSGAVPKSKLGWVTFVPRRIKRIALN